MQVKSYSQFGEDIQLLRFFKEKSSGYYVDIGANNGLRDSNTALLEEQGWSGLLIEANPDLIELAIESRPNSKVIHCAVVSPENVGDIDFYKVVGGSKNLDGLSTVVYSSSFDSKIRDYGGIVHKTSVPAMTLETILRTNNSPGKFDLLSIDVEGYELAVLKSIPFTYFSPKIILVEDNSRGRDCSVRDFLKKYGYIRVHRTGVNDWYVKHKDSIFFRKQKLILTFKLMKWQIERYLGVV